MKTKRIIALMLMLIFTMPVVTAYASNSGDAETGGAVVRTPSNSGSSKNSSVNSGSGSSKSSSSPSKSSSKSSGQTVKSQTLTPKQIAVNSAPKIKPVMQQSINNYVQALQKGYYDVNGSLWLKKYYAPGYEKVKVTWKTWIDDDPTAGNHSLIKYRQQYVTPAIYARIENLPKYSYNTNYKTLYYKYNIYGPSNLLRHRSNPNAFIGNPSNYDSNAQTWNSPNNQEYLFIPADTRAIGTYTITNTEWKQWDVMEKYQAYYSWYVDYGSYGGVKKIGSGSVTSSSAVKLRTEQGPGNTVSAKIQVTTQDLGHIIPVRTSTTKDNVNIEVEPEIIE